VTGLLLGTVSFLKLELNAATAIVAAISIGLGVDYAIHLIQRFREERDLSVAVSRTGEALFAAFFTTASAFFVLMLSTITWNRDFGLLVGLAVFYAFVVTVFVFPAVLSLTQRFRKESQ
jgi:predicted RND superfamily exporter protein